MAHSGGEVAVKRARNPTDDAAAGREDGLSALPDEVLVLILLGLSTEEATRTSILSRRWRSVWTLLPQLKFRTAPDPNLLRDALSASDVPLRYLLVEATDASPQSLTVWLPAAARRVSGEMVLTILVGRRATAGEEEAETSQRGGVVELPCFEKATIIRLHLGFLGLSMPPAAVFARLMYLSLTGVRFHGPGELGDVVSSPRCPCLQKLKIRYSRGLDSINIDSNSLQILEFDHVRGVREVTVVAPALNNLVVGHCFFRYKVQPVVNISAPHLKVLTWMDAYDPNSFHLGSMEHLKKLHSSFFVYGPHGYSRNRACLMLVQQFKASIKYLYLKLYYMLDINDFQYLMEEMTMMPDLTKLDLSVSAWGHSFGACVFHVLRMCSSIKRLVFSSHLKFEFQEQTDCSSGCICGQQTNWTTEELSLKHLEKIEIKEFRASEHELAFVERLLNWVTVLKLMTVTFHDSITESKAKELFQMFQSFSRPGMCMKFYMYQNFSKVLYAPEVSKVLYAPEV